MSTNFGDICCQLFFIECPFSLEPFLFVVFKMMIRIRIRLVDLWVYLKVDVILTMALIILASSRSSKEN